MRASEIYAALYKQGALVSDADIRVAATALTHDLQLVTGTVSHFQRIPGLFLLNWRSP